MENVTDRVVARIAHECGCVQTEYVTSSFERYSKTRFCEAHRSHDERQDMHSDWAPARAR